MPVVSDFIRIVGDEDIRVGDSAQPVNLPFNTGGRHAPATAYIIMMVKGMTVTSNNAAVYLNDHPQPVGWIFNNHGGGVNEWQTQIVHFNGSDLNNGDNVLELRGVTYTGGGSDHFDDYYVRNVICHFHQDV